MKNNTHLWDTVRSTKFIVFFMCAVLALTLGYYLRRWVNDNQAAAASLTQPMMTSQTQGLKSSQETNTFKLETDSKSIGENQEYQWTEPDGVSNSPVRAEVLARRVNDLEITATNFRIEGNLLKVDVCFQMPDSADWSIWKVRLESEDWVNTNLGFELMDIREPSGNLQNWVRCDVLHFVTPSNKDVSEYSLTIEEIASYPSENDLCSYYEHKVQPMLDIRESGIKFRCVYEEWGANVTVLSHPASMSKEQAEMMVFSDEFFTIKGPWIFNFNLSE